MIITDVLCETFRYSSNKSSDSDGHGHPADMHEARQTLLTITTDAGVSGRSFGIDNRVVDALVRPLLTGLDPFYRERIWQTLYERQRLSAALTDGTLEAVDLALWDLAGSTLGQPVYKLLGAFRDKVPAYGSTMCGDDLAGGLDSPQAYGDFALQLVARGYRAIKLHTWQPPMPGAPDPKRDVAACAAVREAVGPDIVLMLDPYHFYTRQQALYLGRELEKLDYYWMEEPMDEASVSSYVWLTEQLQLQICGPETARGGLKTRGEWMLRGAADISRVGTGDVGGITPMMKIVHLAEAFGMQCESHGSGVGNLQALCAMSVSGQYHERGLLHPFIDYETPPPWLNALADPMDDEGYVHVPQGPGLGLDINFDYIRDNLVSP